MPWLSIIHITLMIAMTTQTAQTQRAHSTVLVSMGILETELTALVSHDMHHSLKKNINLPFLANTVDLFGPHRCERMRT